MVKALEEINLRTILNLINEFSQISDLQKICVFCE